MTLVLNGTSPGRAATPDTAALDIVGDIDVRVHVAMNDWTPAGTQTFLSKSTASGSQRSWQFNITTAGALVFIWSADGVATLTATSTANLSATANGALQWVRATLDVNNGASGRDVKFYTSPDGSTWTQLGTTVTSAGVTSIFSGTAPVIVGSIDVGVSNRLIGKVVAAEIRNGIAGTVVADPDFSAQAAGATSFADGTGKTWTITSPALIAGTRTAALSGSGTLAATALARFTRTAALSGTGTLSNVVQSIHPRTVDLSGSGTLSAAVALEASAELSSEGTLSAAVSYRKRPTFSYWEKRRKDFGPRSEYQAEELKPFWYQSDVKGVSVVRYEDGTFATVEVVTEDLEALEGVKIYYGGKDNPVDEDEIAELEGAGYGDYVTTPTVVEA